MRPWRCRRTTTGSTGQRVTSPSVTQLQIVEAGQLKLAAVLGLGPQNAARLGFSVSTDRGDEEREAHRRQVERVRVDGDAHMTNRLADRHGVAFRIHQVSITELQRRAIGEHLVQVRVGKASRLFDLVLGIDDGGRYTTDLPDKV